MCAAVNLYPDSIVERALTELSYEGSSGVAFDKLWGLLTPILPIDDFYKKIIYAWLIKNHNVEVLNAEGNVVIDIPRKYDEVEKGKFFIRVTSDYQCSILTGLPKENNPVIGRAYDLLVEIAKSRAEGIDSLKLAHTTGQDNRSLTTRIKSLGNLVVKVPILRGGRTLSLLTLSKFYDNSAKGPISEKDEKITINIEDLRSRIMNALKNAKHSIRQMADLRRELEMDKSPKIARNFKSLINYLEIKGYLEKVLVVSPIPPKRQFLALKYLKDYVPRVNGTESEEDEESGTLDDADEDELNEELIDDELKDLENEAPASLANIENIEITSSKDSKNFTTFNRIFPLQNQIFQIVHNAGTAGLSSSDLLDTVLGRSYDRLFSKMMECYTPDKLVPNISNNAIVRHYDFKGKTKFYRYLTQPNFLKFSNKEEDPDGSSLLPYNKAEMTLEAQNKKQFTPLNSGVSVVQQSDGTKILNWFGHTSDQGTLLKPKKSSTTSKKTADIGDQPKRKRGRPKKGEERTEKAKQSKVSNEEQSSQVEEIPLVGELPAIPQSTTPEEKNKDKASTKSTNTGNSSTGSEPAKTNETNPSSTATPSSGDKTPASSGEKDKYKHSTKVITVSDLKVTSFKALERMNVIFKVLENSGGAVENSYSFIEAVREEVKQQIDRRTFKKDLRSLIDQRKIYVDGFFIGREKPIYYSLIVLSGTSPENVGKAQKLIKDNLKQQGKALSKRNTVENVDLEFYDDGFKKSFETELSPPPSKKSKSDKASKRATKNKTKGKGDLEDDYDEHAEAIERAYREAQKTNSSTYIAEAESITAQASRSATTSKQKKKPTPRKPAQPKPIIAKTPRVKKEAKNQDWDVTKSKGTKVHGTRNKRNTSNLNSAETMLLFKAVIICKTITKNLIDWTKIAGLFTGVSEETLKRKWPRIRMLMGHNGGRIARRTWKRILLAAVKEGKISLPEVEELNLENLVRIWQDAEILGLSEDTSHSLFANYEDNISHYNFVKTSPVATEFIYDNNSMVQREQYLVSKAFTYENDKDDGELKKNEDGTVTAIGDNKSDEKNTIRKIIIAIILSGTNTNIRKLPLLGSFDKELVDEVFVDLTRKKEVSVSADAKVIIGETLTHVLDNNTYDFSLTKVNQIQRILKESFETKKAFVMSPLFDNSYMVPIIELSARKQLDVVRVDHYRKEVLYGYEARTLEREKLDCDVILAPGPNKIEEVNSETPLVPVGKPCSRIWVDVEGKINKKVWNKVNRLVLTTILSQPGVTISDLLRKLTLILDRAELTEILKWLVDANAIREGEFQGFWLQPSWYTIFGTN